MEDVRGYAAQHRYEGVKHVRVDVAHRRAEARLRLLHAQAHRCELFLLDRCERLGSLLSTCLHPWIQDGLRTLEEEVSNRLLRCLLSQEGGQVKVFIDNFRPELAGRLGFALQLC